jgi:GT2 family glycosyltransferase
MSTAPELAIQVVNYRTRSFLERCLAAVVPDVRASGIAYEISLLDNDSGEDLTDLARSIPGCRAYTAPRNLGFGAGHNLLSAHTRARCLLVLNPDVEFVSPGTAKRLLDTLHQLDRATVAGPKLITPDGRAQRYDHGRLHGVRAQIALRGGHSHWRETNRRQNVAWVSGATMLIERAAFVAIGGFDERLFLYKEDEDLCLRLRQAGGRIIYDPGARVMHHGSVVANRREGLARASSYYFDKHFPHRRVREAFAAAHQGLAHLRL